MEGGYNMEALSVWVDKLLGGKKGQLNTFPVGEFIPYRDRGGWVAEIISIDEINKIVLCKYYSDDGTHDEDEERELQFDGKDTNDNAFSINWGDSYEHQAD